MSTEVWRRDMEDEYAQRFDLYRAVFRLLRLLGDVEVEWCVARAQAAALAREILTWCEPIGGEE